MAAQNEGLGSHISVPVLPQLHYMFLLITDFTGHFIQYIHFDVLKYNVNNLDSQCS